MVQLGEMQVVMRTFLIGSVYGTGRPDFKLRLRREVIRSRDPVMNLAAKATRKTEGRRDKYVATKGVTRIIMT